MRPLRQAHLLIIRDDPRDRVQLVTDEGREELNFHLFPQPLQIKYRHHLNRDQWVELPTKIAGVLKAVPGVTSLPEPNRGLVYHNLLLLALEERLPEVGERFKALASEFNSQINSEAGAIVRTEEGRVAHLLAKTDGQIDLVAFPAPAVLYSKGAYQTQAAMLAQLNEAHQRRLDEVNRLFDTTARTGFNIFNLS